MASIAPITGTLSRAQAAHLLRRTTFGITKEEVDSITGTAFNSSIDNILQPYISPPEPPVDPQTGLTWLNPTRTDANSEDRDLTDYFLAWWMELMRNSSMNIVERMVHFFHTHFTTKKSKVSSSSALYYQNALFRYYALGNFKTLAKKICTDNAMMVFLDGYQNEDGSPQENFARELLELYTIGKGPQIGPDDYTHYTEEDIREAARVLSGYDYDETFTNVDPDNMIPTGILKSTSDIKPQDPLSMTSRHDTDPKVFNGSLGNGGTTIQPATVTNNNTTIENALTELDELIEMIFAKEETAKFICRELYRYFVYYEITDEIETDIIDPLATTFRNNDYELLPVLQQLFNSQHFYDADNAITNDDNFGAIIKSPLELVVGCFRFFQIDFGDTTDLNRLYTIYKDAILPKMRAQGLDLYEPFEVAGYEAYHQTPEFNRHWITNTNLGYRYKFIDDLIDGFRDKDGNDLNIRLDVMPIVENTNYIATPTNPDQIVNYFQTHLHPMIIRQERYDYFRDRVLLDNLSIINWANEWADYQISGDDTGVRGQIEALVRELIQSPEFQLF